MILDKIEVDPDCGAYSPEPDRGHRLLLTMRVETSPSYTAADGVPGYYEWSTVGTDGISEAPPSSSIACGSNELPHELRAAAKYRGKVIVETANTAGQLLLANWAVWNYPA
jgi:hypothetical protein